MYIPYTEMAERYNEIPEGRPVLLHCGGGIVSVEAYEILSQAEKFHLKGNCMYCGHFTPCTVGIDVASVNKYLNLALAQKEVPETVADHYKLHTHHASECIACGSCERNCPFAVGVMEKMKKVAEIFGY